MENDGVESPPVEPARYSVPRVEVDDVGRRNTVVECVQMAVDGASEPIV